MSDFIKIGSQWSMDEGTTWYNGDPPDWCIGVALVRDIFTKVTEPDKQEELSELIYELKAIITHLHYKKDDDARFVEQAVKHLETKSTSTSTSTGYQKVKI